MGDAKRTHLFHPITVGSTNTIRVSDEVGGGLPGDPRTRDGHLLPHGHLGSLDICVKPGHQVLSPIDGLVDPLKAPEPVLRGVRIRGTGMWQGYEVKLLHVVPLPIGTVVAGKPVGVAIDITRRYPGVMNHVHIQAKKGGHWVNALSMFGWFTGVPNEIPKEWTKK